jgi:hypothetical protein
VSVALLPVLPGRLEGVNAAVCAMATLYGMTPNVSMKNVNV